MRSKVSFALMGVFLASGLTACSSSDDNDTEFSSSGYIQFYNGSANSALTTMRGTEETQVLASSSYGDVTSMIQTNTGFTEIEFYRTDSDDQEVILETREIDLPDGQKTLVMLTGDFESPTFNEYRFDREELDDHFRLFGISVVTDQSSYDLYMSDSGSPFSEANLLSTINYESLDEMEFWAPDDDDENFDEGSYTIYLTEPGSTDVIFESNTVSFQFASEYVLVIRSSSGAIQDGIEVDLVLNSSTVSNLDDVNASAQYRLYNSLDDGAVEFTLEGNEDTDPSEVSANEKTDFNEIEFGDYRLSAELTSDSSVSFNNRLVTLNQGESKAIIVYQDADENLTSLSFDESSQPQVYDKEVVAANLVSDFIDVDLYFVRKDETIESAEYLISSIDFGESKSVTLPSDFYELVAVFDDNEDTQILLDRTELLGLNEEANYIITIEESADSPTGYKISLLY
ncbi:DUF4397 domain-containing protein [Aliiglaciecola sp. 3_MG-2023]|uniref:DUF4397 domain-containing protein n=1 Tax=Aliiglaciecola sp. 3_MG-2023 TaxID=3062644 RepID=UPI0026E363F2|nr:DUF4397 domain-containing protein [Aliiglaciecola sp. 3_MG-2023]MDO6694108.1 DUF4397 domain-containing protein [Aliiglaciecola sp. 3_MG-2023]